MMIAGRMEQSGKAEAIMDMMGASMYLMWLLMILQGAMATGAMALVSRSTGARDMKAANLALGQSLLLGVASGAVSGLMIWLVSRQSPDNRRGLAVLAMLIAGASGNLYDNLSAWMPWAGNGEVRDFVQVYFAEPGWWPGWPSWPFDPWPIFNLADALIVTGFVSLISGFAHLQVKPEEATESSAEADSEPSVE